MNGSQITKTPVTKRKGKKIKCKYMTLQLIINQIINHVRPQRRDQTVKTVLIYVRFLYLITKEILGNKREDMVTP